MSDTANTKPVQRFSWKKAANGLSETEKSRIFCLLLTCFDQVKPTSEDFELAATQFGSAKGGFAKMYSNHIKKLKEINAYIIDGENIDDVPTPHETPTKGLNKKPVVGAKRKAATSDSSEDVIDGAEPKTPKKPRASPKKKSPAKVKDDDEEEEETEIKDNGKNEAKVDGQDKNETKVESPDSVLGSDFEMVDAETPKE